MKWLNILADMFFPPKCMFCRCDLPAPSKLLACERCLRTLPFTQNDGCFGGVGDISYVIAPFFYTDPVKTAVRRYKFHPCKVYSDSLSFFLGSYLAKVADMKAIDIVTCVPVGARRRRQRGFDQSELIARHVADMLDLKCDTDMLIRLRNTRRQSRLSRFDRALNVADAFGCVQAAEDMTVLLIDDIYTTGATALNCAKALKRAGAKKIILGVLATASKQTEYEKMSNKIPLIRA